MGDPVCEGPRAGPRAVGNHATMPWPRIAPRAPLLLQWWTPQLHRHPRRRHTMCWQPQPQQRFPPTPPPPPEACPAGESCPSPEEDINTGGIAWQVHYTIGGDTREDGEIDWLRPAYVGARMDASRWRATQREGAPNRMAMPACLPAGPPAL